MWLRAQARSQPPGSDRYGNGDENELELELELEKEIGLLDLEIDQQIFTIKVCDI
jgi:hypothetical protein